MIGTEELVDAECLRLADLLDTLSEMQWDAQSLCEKWRTREVIAHLTMPARYTPERFGAEIAACGGDFTLMSDRAAARDGRLPAASLIADLRSPVMRAFVPPGGGHNGALNHVVIHGLDVTASIGVHCAASDESLRRVLDQLTRGGGVEHFGHDVSDLHLVATDLDWSFGSGREVSATAADLALWLCNRRVTTVRDSVLP